MQARRTRFDHRYQVIATSMPDHLAQHTRPWRDA